MLGTTLLEQATDKTTGEIIPLLTIVTGNGGPFRSSRFQAFIATHPELTHVRTRANSAGQNDSERARFRHPEIREAVLRTNRRRPRPATPHLGLPPRLQRHPPPRSRRLEPAHPGPPRTCQPRNPLISHRRNPANSLTRDKPPRRPFRHSAVVRLPFQIRCPIFRVAVVIQRRFDDRIGQRGTDRRCGSRRRRGADRRGRVPGVRHQHQDNDDGHTYQEDSGREACYKQGRTRFRSDLSVTQRRRNPPTIWTSAVNRQNGCSR